MFCKYLGAVHVSLIILASNDRRDAKLPPIEPILRVNSNEPCFSSLQSLNAEIHLAELNLTAPFIFCQISWHPSILTTRNHHHSNYLYGMIPMSRVLHPYDH